MRRLSEGEFWIRPCRSSTTSRDDLGAARGRQRAIVFLLPSESHHSSNDSSEAPGTSVSVTSVGPISYAVATMSSRLPGALQRTGRKNIQRLHLPAKAGGNLLHLTDPFSSERTQIVGLTRLRELLPFHRDGVPDDEKLHVRMTSMTFFIGVFLAANLFVAHNCAHRKSKKP